MDQFDCLKRDYETCTFGTDPPIAGADYVNLKDFGNYLIDGKYHMKMVWSLGESVEWKQARFPKKTKTIKFSWIFFMKPSYS